LPSGRYKHSAEYLKRTFSDAGFVMKTLVESVGRLELGKPVIFWIAIAEKRS
jgi:predicted TPR repeat methyltransferase